LVEKNYELERELYRLSQEEIMRKINISEDWLEKNKEHRLSEEQFLKFRQALRVYSERYWIETSGSKQENLFEGGKQ
jgi:hypothetical protein